ncbi:hypothetical protein WMF27_09835 [Sorangium sp. So ce281]|uniref:hypothetical protein n=1 Tax=unclassified Sorangium TaxID=2621164 RepID=UPI003F616872
MSSAASLKTFLKDKKARDEESGRLADKEEKIKLRSTAIGELFNHIEAWLKPSVDEGIVELERDSYVHPDEQLGMLSEESMRLIVGVSEVLFAPRTGTIAGASARVDMTCDARTLPIVLLPDRGWHFLVRGPITRTEPVTEDSFADALRELLGG